MSSDKQKMYQVYRLEGKVFSARLKAKVAGRLGVPEDSKKQVWSAVATRAF